MVTELKWWQSAVFYQIYPRSFADGNDDGIGDFAGMIQKLDYLQDLGVDAIWLSPHFPSPQFDCGYDITDYTGVAPEYGTMDDFKRFLDGVHHRGMRLILDLVLNHTSHLHPWFLESRSSRDNPRRDWYIWRDGKPSLDGSFLPPNNWISSFDGLAWEFDEGTGQYYYHYFLKQQPDLNWRNPQVKRAMWDAVRFWLDLGVDGFRLDAIGTIFENPDLPDHPLDIGLAELNRIIRRAHTSEERARARAVKATLFQHQLQQPGMHELMQELRSVVDEYDDRVLVAEDEHLEYHGNGENELHLVFNFPLMRTRRLTPTWVRLNQKERLSSLAAISPLAWPCNTLGNHDRPRVYNRYGDGMHDAELARLSLALMLTLRGTPFLYNGEEIGMTDLYLEDIDQFRDPIGIWEYHAEIETFGTPPDQALRNAAQLTRDKNRTPMQWQNALNAGFSSAGVHTWLPVNPNFAEGVNVRDQLDDPDSLWRFYQRLLRLRKDTPALIEGDYTPLHEHAEHYLAFTRSCRQQTCLVILNMSPNAQRIHFNFVAKSCRLLFSSHDHFTGPVDLNRINLAPFEIFIVEMG
jgi:alpha-glucosidase